VCAHEVDPSRRRVTPTLTHRVDAAREPSKKRAYRYACHTVECGVCDGTEMVVSQAQHAHAPRLTSNVERSHDRPKRRGWMRRIDARDTRFDNGSVSTTRQKTNGRNEGRRNEQHTHATQIQEDIKQYLTELSDQLTLACTLQHSSSNIIVSTLSHSSFNRMVYSALQVLLCEYGLYLCLCTCLRLSRFCSRAVFAVPQRTSEREVSALVVRCVRIDA
jgi:hypothetical protein